MKICVARVPVAVAVVVAAVLGPAACSSSGGGARPVASSAAPGSPGTVDATVGDLTISGGYIPQPASPAVAAAYFSVRNNGATADRIVAITSNVSSSVMAMTETTSGGVGSMSDLGSVAVPAHATTLFTPGHRHLMLQNPTRSLKNGQRVTLTITFAHAGKVVLNLPVVPLTGPSDASTYTTSPMPGMTGMTG